MDNKPNAQGFFSALETLAQTRRMTMKGCALGELLASLGEKEREKLDQILRTDAIPATQIATVLEANGYKIHVSTVRYHRAGIKGKGCQCFSKT